MPYLPPAELPQAVNENIMPAVSNPVMIFVSKFRFFITLSVLRTEFSGAPETSVCGLFFMCFTPINEIFSQKFFTEYYFLKKILHFQEPLLLFLHFGSCTYDTEQIFLHKGPDVCGQCPDILFGSR